MTQITCTIPVSLEITLSICDFHVLELMAYLKKYADKFGVTDCIRYNHRVLNVERAADYQETGRWTIHYIDK
jgi:cation diffusion facilitator CzcD-associated flavoprotein CzcO